MYLTESVDFVPTKLSQLENDAEYTSREEVLELIGTGGGSNGSVSIPTKVSELENDANYTSQEEVLELIENNTSISVPTKISELENDTGYIQQEEASTLVEQKIEEQISTLSSSNMKYAEVTLPAATVDSTNETYNTVGEYITVGNWKLATMITGSDIIVKCLYNDDFIRFTQFTTNGWDTLAVSDESSSGFNKLFVVVDRTDGLEFDCFGSAYESGNITGYFVITENNASFPNVTVGSTQAYFQGNCTVLGAQTSSGLSATGTTYFGLGLSIGRGICDITSDDYYYIAFAHEITQTNPPNNYSVYNGIKCSYGGGENIRVTCDVVWGVPSNFEKYPAEVVTAFLLDEESNERKRNIRTEEEARAEGFFDRA